MKNFTKEHATDLLNWFEKEGQDNWGTWGNYPQLPAGASYASFDDCHCRVMLDEVLMLEDGTKFNCIATGRRIPGKNKGAIHFSDLKGIIKGVEMVRYEGYQHDWERAQVLKAQQIAYEAQSESDKQIIFTLNAEFLALKGTANSRKRTGELTVELLKFVQPVVLQPWSSWILEAQKFDSAIAYADFKKSEIK